VGVFFFVFPIFTGSVNDWEERSKNSSTKKKPIMKKQTAILLTVLLGLLAISACQKEIISDRIGGSTSRPPDSAVDIPELTVSLTDYLLPASTFLSVQEGRKALAYAVSAELLDNPDFRTTVYGMLAPNESRYKEILLGTFKNRMVSYADNGSIVNKTVQELLNDRLRQLNAFVGAPDPLGDLLAQDNMVCLWFPNKYIHTLEPAVFEDALPVISSENHEHWMFLGKKKGELPESDSYVGLHISEAQANLLYRPATQTYGKGNIPFEAMHGFGASEHAQVAARLESLPEYALQPGFKVVNILDDVQALCASKYESPDLLLQVPDRDDPSYECSRGEHELKLKGNYSKHVNYFQGFRLNNLAVYDQISAHPCDSWSGNELRSFMFKWLVAANGDVQDSLRQCVAHCYPTDLLHITVQVTPVYYTYTTYSPFGFPVKQTKLLYKTKEVSRELKTYHFPELVLPPIFSAVPAENHWKPDVHGDAVWFDAVFVNFNPCQIGNTPVVTAPYQLGGSFYFKKPVLDSDGKLDWQPIKTVSKTVDYQITAGASYYLGRTRLEYCQSYYLPSKWNQRSSTGSVVFEFYAPWFN